MQYKLNKSKTMKASMTLSIIASAIISANAFAIQTSVLNFVTTESGLNRVTYGQLAEQGIDLNGVEIDSLGLMHDGELFPRFLADNDDNGVFGPNDYIDFIAEDVYNRYTDEAVYTLHIDNDSVEDISVLNTNNLPSASSDVSFKGSVTSSLEEKNAYSVTTPNLDDPFYMDFLQATSSPVSKSYNIDLPNLASNADDLIVSVRISGSSNLQEEIDHNVVVRFNGQEFASLKFDGYENHTLTGSIPASLASVTNNVVEVELPFDHDAPLETIVIESIDVDYERDLIVDDNALSFVSDKGNLVVNGLTGDEQIAPTVYIKSSEGIQKLNDLQQGSDGSLEINVDAGVEFEYFVAKDDAIATPSLQDVVENVDISTGEAQYLVIAHKDFMDSSLDQLMATRSATYSTKLVDVAQIYAQFGRHTAEAEPIFEYIQYAVENLGTEMVLLVGGDTYDYHNYVGDSQSFVPTMYTPIDGTNLIITQAPSDAAYGDIDKDGIPEVAIGRLPVRTSQELSDVIAKIHQFEQRDYAGSAVFAADQIDNGHGFSFVPDAENIIARLPEALQTDLDSTWQNTAGVSFDNNKAYVETDGAELAKSKLIAAINEGVELTSYLGHSNIFKWSNNLFNTSDMAALTNTNRPTVMTQYGCWNTYFVLPSGNSMSQVAMLTGENGAAAVLGSSTLTLASSEAALGSRLFDEMYVPGKTIGQALIDAKRTISGNASNNDVLLGWQIMGDPAIVMKPAN